MLSQKHRPNQTNTTRARIIHPYLATTPIKREPPPRPAMRIPDQHRCVRQQSSANATVLRFSSSVAIRTAIPRQQKPRERPEGNTGEPHRLAATDDYR